MLSKVKLVLVRWAAEFSSLPRRLKQTVGGVIAIALVVGAIFLGRTIHHHVADQPKNPTATTSQNQKISSQKAASPKPPESKANSSKTGGLTVNNAPSQTSLKSGANSSKSSSTAIPNTGPGDDLAIFVGATAAGALVHFTVSRRRQNS